MGKSAMKRIAIRGVVLLLVLSLTGCGVEEAEESVYQALKVGMRLIDTARYYGNEVGVGRGLQRAIDEGIRRQRAYFGKL